MPFQPNVHLPDELPGGEVRLLHRIRRGETQCFAELVGPYRKVVSRVCECILGNRADTEEAAQDALIKAFFKLCQLREGECFKSWLLQIARNEALMLRRKRQLRLQNTERLRAADDSLLNDLVDTHEDPYEALEHREFAFFFSQALLSLAQIYREVFILREMQHLNASETARILGITEMAVTTRLHRARLQMKECLSAYLVAQREPD